MLVAITGGSGFIGQNLAYAHLKRGDHVRLLSRAPRQDSNVKWIQGDLTDPDIDLSALINGVDVLYHCAAELNDESAMPVLHVDGTRRLVEAAKGEVGRWVQLSSVGAYGPCLDGVVTELSPEYPANTYEVTKTISDGIVRQSGIPFVILRPSIVFSETMSNQSLFQMQRMISKGLFFYIGKPGAMVNYIHVDDVMEALCLCATDSRAVNKTFNLSQTTNVESMVAALMAGSRASAGFYRLPFLPVYVMAVLFGWIPGFPLTRARVAALTSKCSYASNKIEQELGFEFGDTLESRFRVFGNKVCH